ncbi:Pycsar system effector family protein [Nonomuraea sp. NPDC026600]|uniref:Pycsar system effector family protein n=1 Tax=Nonomuraea sp. NPDC026600 TaxID=3155363 RepID=UPI0033FC781A
MTTSTFPGAPAVLQRESDAVRVELARVDVKATALIGWAGTMVAILAAAVSVGHLPLPSTVAVVIGGTLLLAAAVTLLWGVIRPALPAPGAMGYGFARHAVAGSTDGLIDALRGNDHGTTQRLADELLQLSVLAQAKYRRLRHAVDLLLAALVVLVAALPLGALS